MSLTDLKNLYNGDYRLFINEIKKHIGKIDKKSPFLRLYYLNNTTEFKLYSANYHFERAILLFKEGKLSSIENQNQIWAEIEAFYFTLKSALDILAQEIKIVYLIKDIPEDKININIVKDKLKKMKERLVISRKRI